MVKVMVVMGVPPRGEEDLGPPAGRRPVCVLTRDAAIAVLTIPVTRFDPEPVGHLDLESRIELDHALRYALDIQY